METQEIPDIVIGRLPIYLRALQRMEQNGKQVTSSQELGELLGISPPQIRKDLSQFGEFGKQGTGYNVEFLVKQIRKILNLEQVWDMVIIGAGDVGHALARYQGFLDRGFQVKMIFDNDPEKIGKKIGEYPILDVRDMRAIIQASGIKVAMLTIPAAFAQEVTDQLVEAGIKAILNYAPIQINTPKEVRVQYLDPAIHLQKMSYYLK
jgi:redox-sensing transcriptional repressor